MIAQQWLRLVFWQLSMRQGLLSSSSDDPTLSYEFPCLIAKSLCDALGKVSMAAVHVHGMAIVRLTLSHSYVIILIVHPTRSLSEPSRSHLALSTLCAYLDHLTLGWKNYGSSFECCENHRILTTLTSRFWRPNSLNKREKMVTALFLKYMRRVTNRTAEVAMLHARKSRKNNSASSSSGHTAELNSRSILGD